MTDAPEAVEPASTRAFWIGFAIGAPILLLGVRGVLLNSRETRPAELARWIVGSALLHDALVLPVVLLIGFLARRVVPDWGWPAARWALATTGILLLVSRPFVGRYGVNPANPTVLPRDYGLGVAVALGLVWVAAMVWAVRLRARGLREPDDEG